MQSQITVVGYHDAHRYFSYEFPDATEEQWNEFYYKHGSDAMMLDMINRHGMRDIMGNQLNVGDKIAYAVMSGRSAMLFVYEIKRINLMKGTVTAQALEHANRYSTPTKPSTLQYPHSRCLKIS